MQTPQPPPSPPPPSLSTPFSPNIDQNMAIFGLQVMASVLGIGTWFFAKSLLFGHIQWFQDENFWTSPQKGEGRALPFPYKHRIIDKKGYGVKTTPLEILTSYLA